MEWNPSQYSKFAQPRLRPALDLLARIPAETPDHIVDLGCGPGNVTKLLQERWPKASILGVDHSADMLAQCQQDYPDIGVQQADIANWQPNQPCDIIFSNAALHWLPEHQALFSRLAGFLSSAGVLAIQMPNNTLAPSHQMIEATIKTRQWSADFTPLQQQRPWLSVSDYYEWLTPHVKSLDIWETEYLHVLTGDNPVVEWTKGTALKPFIDALNDAHEKESFEQTYRALIASAYPARNGCTLFPFRRLFIVAAV